MKRFLLTIQICTMLGTFIPFFPVAQAADRCCFCTNADASKKICLTTETVASGACSTAVSTSGNAKLSGYTCSTEEDCTLISDGGKCSLIGAPATIDPDTIVTPPTAGASDLGSGCCLCASGDGKKRNTCLRDAGSGCGSLVSDSGNDKLAGYKCSDKVACTEIAKDGAGRCAVIADAKTFDPTKIELTSKTDTGEALFVTEAVPIKLNVAIPGLTFAEGIPLVDSPTGPYYEIPFLAQYVAAIYRYLLGLGVVVAAIMVVYGGFKYILSATSIGVQDGKTILVDAVIGLVIVFGCQLLLLTINPFSAALLPLRVKAIPHDDFAGIRYPESETPTGDFIQPTKEDEVSMPSPYNALTIPNEADCGNKHVSQAIRDAALRSQHETGIPGSVMIAQWAYESGFGKSCIGKAGKKNNCFGVKCTIVNSEGKTEYKGNEKPLTAPDIECPSTCTAARTALYQACFQDYDVFSFDTHAKVVKRKNWEKYNGTPEGFARFVESNKYDVPGYSLKIIQIMQNQCLLPYKPVTGSESP